MPTIFKGHYKKRPENAWQVYEGQRFLDLDVAYEILPEADAERLEAILMSGLAAVYGADVREAVSVSFRPRPMSDPRHGSIWPKPKNDPPDACRISASAVPPLETLATQRQEPR